MFLGLDHIALSCVGLEKASSVLTNCLYTTRFAQLRIVNDAAKINLLTAYQPTHDIAYLYKSGFLSIELTDRWSSLLAPQGPVTDYQVLFGSLPPAATLLARS